MEEEKKFRFETREEYEREATGFVVALGEARRRRSADLGDLEERYEELLEEYLSFCAGDRDG